MCRARWARAKNRSYSLIRGVGACRDAGSPTTKEEASHKLPSSQAKVSPLICENSQSPGIVTPHFIDITIATVRTKRYLRWTQRIPLNHHRNRRPTQTHRGELAIAYLLQHPALPLTRARATIPRGHGSDVEQPAMPALRLSQPRYSREPGKGQRTFLRCQHTTYRMFQIISAALDLQRSRSWRRRPRRGTADSATRLYLPSSRTGRMTT